MSALRMHSSSKGKLLLIFAFLLAPSVVVAEPLPPPGTLHERSQCNADNCLRALRAHSSSASSFCTTFTESINTATTSLPAYATSACGSPLSPSRVSSACSCIVTSTSTPCATDAPTQVVGYPGFECPTPTLYTTATEGPWTVTDSTTPGYTYGPFGNIYCGNDQYAYQGNGYA